MESNQFMIAGDVLLNLLTVSVGRRHMLNVTWERKDLSFNNQGFLSNPSMVIVALDRDRLWDKVPVTRNTIFVLFYCTQSFMVSQIENSDIL